MRVCSNCERAAFSSGGVFCMEFHEEIWREEVAEECGVFDPVPWAGEKGA